MADVQKGLRDALCKLYCSWSCEDTAQAVRRVCTAAVLGLLSDDSALLLCLPNGEPLSQVPVGWAENSMPASDCFDTCIRLPTSGSAVQELKVFPMNGGTRVVLLVSGDTAVHTAHVTTHCVAPLPVTEAVSTVAGVLRACNVKPEAASSRFGTATMPPPLAERSYAEPQRERNLARYGESDIAPPGSTGFLRDGGGMIFGPRNEFFRGGGASTFARYDPVFPGAARPPSGDPRWSTFPGEPDPDHIAPPPFRPPPRGTGSNFNYGW